MQISLLVLMQLQIITPPHPPFSLFIGKLHMPVGLRPKIPPSILILQKEEVQFELDLIHNSFSIFIFYF